VWYSVEEDWDYGYLQVSSDGGLTWDILETPNTSLDNPIGNSFGPGYTGDSHGWITERIDLSPYAGREILVRFHYVTDDAVNGAGMCFRNITIPEAGLLENDQDWQAGGFILTDNRVKQDYQVKAIQVGAEDRVVDITLDANNSGELVIPAPHNLNRLVVAVAALAPKTLQPAPYTLTVEPAN
jgi:bacillopeptidase F (M6 metalloprotease family)